MPLYNLKYIEQRKALIERVKFETRLGMTVEFKRYSPKRSGKQNRYSEVLFAFFASQYGETKEYIKQVMFKQYINPEIFKTEYVNKKTGVVRIAWKSTRDIPQDQFATAITKMRNYASMKCGIYLPEANEDLTHYENEIKKYEKEGWL